MSRLALALLGLTTVYFVADLVRPETIRNFNQVTTVLSDVNATLNKE